MGRIESFRREFAQELPRIVRHAQVVFRSVRCPQKKEDCIAEAVALCWKWWLRLRKRGKNPRAFVSALATFAVRAVKSGRRVCGQEHSKDVLSPFAQARRGFTVSSIPSFSTLTSNPFAEALQDNTRTPVEEQVAFRCDFPAWLITNSERNRRIIEEMMLGERTMRLSSRFGISPARVSQLRQQFHHDWQRFVGEPV